MKYILIIVLHLILISDGIGQLDVSFNENGKRFISDDVKNIMFSQAVIQNDGKTILAGRIEDSLIVIRLLNNGTYDDNFGDNGMLFKDLESNFEMVKAIVVTNTNSIFLFCHYFTGISSHTAIVKLNSNGTLNSSFGIDGVLVLENTSSPLYALLQSDTAFILVTTTGVHRLDLEGDIDLDFGDEGKLEINNIDGINDLFIQSEGKILIAGELDGNTAILRINANGSFDNIFGTNGVKTVDVDNDPGDRASSVIQLENGNILVGGYYTNHIFLMQLSSTNGDLITSYGTEGIMSYSYPQATNSICNAIAEDLTTNDILVAGTALYGAKSYFALSRVSSSGTLEAYAAIDMNDSFAEANSICIQSDRKIVIAGSAIHEDKYHMAVARFMPDFSTLIQSVESSEAISAGINLFPNPSSHYIHLHSVYSLEQVKVLDMLGNEVLNQSLSGNTKLDISLLPKGLYNFILTTDRGTGYKKVSVQ